MKTYGTCKYSGNSWVIEAEPHVMMRMRRVFPKIDNQLGKIVIKSTDEVCHELLWFMERYPLIVDNIDLLEEGSYVYTKTIEAFDNILSGNIAPREFELALPPREYQSIAADLALRMNGLLIADEVGLGKTMTSICCLTDPNTRPALVVTLTHLPNQWEGEIKKFAPDLSTHIIKTGKPYDIVNYGVKGVKKRVGKRLDLSRDLDNPNFPDVLIINYHKLAGWAETLSGICKTVVFDEIQELRHNESKKYSGASLIARKASMVCGLSATPIYNYGIEIFNIMNIIKPGVLGTRKEFMNSWCSNSTYGNKILINDPKSFGMYLREQGLMIRRTRKDVGRELPPLSKVVHTVEFSDKELKSVSNRVAELAKLILRTGKDVMGFDKMRASEELSWRLRQATGVGKAPYVADFIEMVLEQEEKVLVYAWHREVYSILMDRLKKFNPVMYTGSESTSQKLASKDKFCNGDARVLMMSLRAGAGLDGLQHHTNTVVFAELDWSPQVHHQNEGRVCRDGQTNPVMAYYLVTEEGSDPVVSEALGIKKQQSDGIINPSDEDFTQIQIDPNNIKKLAEAYLAQSKVRK